MSTLERLDAVVEELVAIKLLLVQLVDRFAPPADIDAGIPQPPTFYSVEFSQRRPASPPAGTGYGKRKTSPYSTRPHSQ